MCLAGEQKSVLVMVLLPSIVAGSRDLHTKKTSYSMMQDIYIKKQKVVLCSQTEQDLGPSLATYQANWVT